MARPLVHRMVHQQDRPGFQSGSEWACPFCPHQVVYYPLHHKVMVTVRRRSSTPGPWRRSPSTWTTSSLS
jgi:hypothetical protein